MFNIQYKIFQDKNQDQNQTKPDSVIYLIQLVSIHILKEHNVSKQH